jgi:alkylation response protein AidB-like acyl-CoA dehydrogenase
LPDGRSPFRDAVAAAIPEAADGRALWRSLGRAGLLEPVAGGPEVDAARLGDLLAELDARLPVGPVLSVCVQVATVLPLLRVAAAGGALAASVRDRALRGEAVVALAATDAGVSGSALLDARTEVRPSGDGVLLTGGKDWIANAGHCDHALVLARHRPARHFTSFCWVLVPAGCPGVSCRPATTTLFDGAALGHLRFDGVALDRAHVVGRPGRALAEFAARIGTERLAGALWARALCRRVLADTHEHLRGRSAGAGTLWENAAVRERFARCLVELRRLDALCAAHGAGPGGASDGMVLKAACAETVDRVLGECASLRGADAFRDGGLASLRAQAAMFGIAGGATGAMLAGIADHADEVLGSAG